MNWCFWTRASWSECSGFLPFVIYAKWRLFAGRPAVLETVLLRGSTQYRCRACTGRHTRTEEETTRGDIAAEPRRAGR